MPALSLHGLPSRLYIPLFALVLLAMPLSGCGKAVTFIANTGNPAFGLTIYVGGAGPIGNVGSLDVPAGLQDARYQGAIEVFPWQGFTHAGDQMNLSRNRSKGVELSNKIRDYRRQYPNKKINIVALSAGTGIAAFALEYLPEDVKIDNGVFLACSMSSRYDLTRALRRLNGKLYVIYSDSDPILRNVVWYTGTVDRASPEDGIAGLRGFRLPDIKGPDTERQYAKVINVPWRIDFAGAGYDGGHIDCTSREFVRRYIGPIFVGNDESLVGREGRLADAPFTSRPAKPPKRSRSRADSTESAETVAADPEAGPGARPSRSRRGPKAVATSQDAPAEENRPARGERRKRPAEGEAIPAGAEEPERRKSPEDLPE